MKDDDSIATTDRIALMQTFVRIVDAGSLSAAAKQLGTTQPTISRRLQTLERLLGLRLIHRSTHALNLTSDGERCYTHARTLAETWQTMADDLRGAQDEPTGTLRVVVPHAFGQEQLIAPLADYLLRYPRVAVEWQLHDRAVDFLAESLDCAIQIGPVNDPNVVALLLAEVPRIVVAAPQLLQNIPEAEHIDALPDLPWVALSAYYHDDVCLDSLDGAPPRRFSVRPRMGTDSLYALRNTVIRGVGVGIASKWVVTDDIRHGRLVHAVPRWQAKALPVYLIYPYARFYPARLRVFIDIMRSAMPGMIGMEIPAHRIRAT